MVLGIIASILGRRSKKNVKKSVYVPLLEAKRIVIGGREYIVKNYTITDNGIVAETFDGKIIRIPFSESKTPSGEKS